MVRDMPRKGFRSVRWRAACSDDATKKMADRDANSTVSVQEITAMFARLNGDI